MELKARTATKVTGIVVVSGVIVAVSLLLPRLLQPISYGTVENASILIDRQQLPKTFNNLHIRDVRYVIRNGIRGNDIWLEGNYEHEKSFCEELLRFGVLQIPSSASIPIEVQSEMKNGLLSEMNLSWNWTQTKSFITTSRKNNVLIYVWPENRRCLIRVINADQ